MRPEDRDAALLWDMREYARRVVSYVQDRSFEDYLATPMMRDAVERAVLVIGEAAAKVSRAFQEAHPEVPWRPIIAQRHILVHEYGEIDHAKIWRVATVHVPELFQVIDPLVPESPEGSDG